jgi:hypothetical protein
MHKICPTHQLRHEIFGKSPYLARQLSVFKTGNLPRGVPEVDECGLAEIGNSKEETRGTQFRQVWAARCVIPYLLYAAQLWIDWVCLQDDAYIRERGPCLALYSPGGRVASRFEERVLVGYG